MLEAFTNLDFNPLFEGSLNDVESGILNNVRQLQVGYGGKNLRVDHRGLWLGADQFADAPFSVDMEGNVTATSLSLGSLSGSLDDIADGTTYKRALQNELTGGDRAFYGLNTSSEIIKGFLNTQLNSKSLPADGVRVDANGIYGRKSGSTTFYIDSNGDAYFSGDITASTVTGSTITGGTIQTATTGERIKLSSTNTNRIEFLKDDTVYGLLEVIEDGSDGVVRLVDPYSGSYGLYLDSSIGSGANTTASLKATGAVVSAGGTSTVYSSQLLVDTDYFGVYHDSGSNKIITTLEIDSDWIPFTDDNYYLGSSSKEWAKVYTNGMAISGNFEFQGVHQPLQYTGYVNSGGSSGTPFPSGWSVSKLATGRYRITHNFSDVDYTVVANAVASNTRMVTIESRASDYFDVRIADLTPVLVDSDFMFSVQKSV